MTREQIYKVKPRSNVVIVRMLLNNVTKSGIITSADAERPNSDFRFEVVAIGPKVEDLKEGDMVYIGDAGLVPLDIEDRKKDEVFHYTVDSFIKFIYDGK